MPTRVASPPEEEHLRHGETVGMRDGEERRETAHRGKPPAGAPMKLEVRRTAAANDLDIAPQNALRVSRAERLHGRFFRSETAGEVNGRHAPPRAVRDLGVGEDAADEPL